MFPQEEPNKKLFLDYLNVLKKGTKQFKKLNRWSNQEIKDKVGYVGKELPQIKNIVQQFQLNLKILEKLFPSSELTKEEQVIYGKQMEECKEFLQIMVQLIFNSILHQKKSRQQGQQQKNQHEKKLEEIIDQNYGMFVVQDLFPEYKAIQQDIFQKYVLIENKDEKIQRLKSALWQIHKIVKKAINFYNGKYTINYRRTFNIQVGLMLAKIEAKCDHKASQLKQIMNEIGKFSK